jgi:Fe-S cluster assembly scaffold protein SufB
VIVSRVITDGRSLKKVIEPRKGEDLKVVVVFVATGDQRFEIDLTALHSEPYTGSDVVIRGVVFDQAAVTFRGLIDIRKGAKQSKAFLRADALLLGDKAHADLIPSLTINENEVQAGHGATVGRINDEQLFYLMSRGLGREKAVQLLVTGFLSAVMSQLSTVDKLKVERSIKRVYERQARLPHLPQASEPHLSG